MSEHLHIQDNYGIVTYHLNGFPMAPTSNQMYASVRGRLIKSNAARIYEQRCKAWSYSKLHLLEEIKTMVGDKALRVDMCFIFPKSRLFTQKETIKKLDYSNRIKAAQDCLSALLDIDDSHFFCGYKEKAISLDDREYINFTISETNIKTI